MEVRQRCWLLLRKGQQEETTQKERRQEGRGGEGDGDDEGLKMEGFKKKEERFKGGH